MKSHKDLDAWKRSVALVTNIYSITSKFPKEEIYGISNQVRKAAVSLPSNIAEGAARKNSTEFIQFLYIALGSNAELETQIIICRNLNYLSEKVSIDILKEISEIRNMILGLIKFMKEK